MGNREKCTRLNVWIKRTKMSMAMPINVCWHCWTTKFCTIVSLKSKLTWFDYSKWWDNMEWGINAGIFSCCFRRHRRLLSTLQIALCRFHGEIVHGIWIWPCVVKQPASTVNINERHRCLQQTIYKQHRWWWWVQHHNIELNPFEWDWRIKHNRQTQIKRITILL